MFFMFFLSNLFCGFVSSCFFLRGSVKRTDTGRVSFPEFVSFLLVFPRAPLSVLLAPCHRAEKRAKISERGIFRLCTSVRWKASSLRWIGRRLAFFMDVFLIFSTGVFFEAAW